MAKVSQNNKETNGPIVIEKKERKPRTQQHTFKLLETQHGTNQKQYLGIVDGKVVSVFTYDANKASLMPMDDNMDVYFGYTRYVRRHKDEFKTIMFAKSEILENIIPMTDVVTMHSFLDNMISAQLERVGMKALDTNDDDDDGDMN